MTPFSKIYRLFLFSIQDYELKNYFETSPEIAEDMLEVLLIKAIPDFFNCKKNLNSINEIEKSFEEDLSLQEINILSDLMVLNWLERQINDITSMNLNLQDSDFKHYSEERNLREKSEYYDRWREIVNQSINQYGLANTKFKNWAIGLFDLE